MVALEKGTSAYYVNISGFYKYLLCWLFPKRTLSSSLIYYICRLVTNIIYTFSLQTVSQGFNVFFYVNVVDFLVSNKIFISKQVLPVKVSYQLIVKQFGHCQWIINNIPTILFIKCQFYFTQYPLEYSMVLVYYLCGDSAHARNRILINYLHYWSVRDTTIYQCIFLHFIKILLWTNYVGTYPKWQTLIRWYTSWKDTFYLYIFILGPFQYFHNSEIFIKHKDVVMFTKHLLHLYTTQTNVSEVPTDNHSSLVHLNIALQNSSRNNIF